MQTLRTISTLVLAAALGTGMIANAALATPRAPSGDDHSSSASQVVSDAWITTKVKSELATTRDVKSTDVTVKTTDGVVTLTGVLATTTDVRKAVAAAKSVKGVRDVDASGLKAGD